VRADVDAEVAEDILSGPLIFRLLTGHAPLTQEQAVQIADAARDGLLARESTGWLYCQAGC
jgi:hypothetical protein